MSPAPLPWPVYSPEAEHRAVELIRRGSVYDYSGSGPVIELETMLTLAHEGRHAISTNSGTSALFALYAAIGVGRGDEVIVPNLTFLSTVSPLLWLGATPILCDSGEAEDNLTVESILPRITPRTRAIAVTHLFGQPADMPGIWRLAKERNIKLVEDCSHGHASRIGSRPMGVFGDGAVYSLGSSKMVSGGHGGVVITPHDEIRDAVLLIAHFKPRTRTDLLDPALRSHGEFALGGNLRMSPISAVLAIDHLTRLAELSAAKVKNVEALAEAAIGVLASPIMPGDRHNGTYFDIVFGLPPGRSRADRDRLVEHLSSFGLPAKAPSTRPLNRVLRNIGARPVEREGPLWRRLARLASEAPSDETLPNSTGRHDRMISFPSPLLYDAELRYANELSTTFRSALRKATWLPPSL